MFVNSANPVINMDNTRITPERIVGLKDNEIFVFGSNLSGIHGAGAAKFALNFGARYGTPNGIQGQTYAIPTKSIGIKRTLTLQEIKPYVDEFIHFAIENKNVIFLVTEIGCGLAGIKVEDMAPLFKKAVGIKNVYLPQRFWNILEKEI